MSYSGKKKQNSRKTLFVTDGQTGRIICLYESPGSVHDLEMFRQSGIYLHPYILLVADKGFQGIHKLHANSLIPHKSYKKRPLTEERKEFDHSPSAYRIRIEHVNRRIKRFKILDMSLNS